MSDANDRSLDVTYSLCAVQNHLGTTPHGGHYVAEVMDWITGVWWECNDSDITWMKDGPSASFDPEECSEEDREKVTGSANAYNLFYVEQRYLSEKICFALRNVRNSVSSGGVLEEIASCRDSRFATERE